MRREEILIPLLTAARLILAGVPSVTVHRSAG